MRPAVALLLLSAVGNCLENKPVSPRDYLLAERDDNLFGNAASICFTYITTYLTTTTVAPTGGKQ